MPPLNAILLGLAVSWFLLTGLFLWAEKRYYEGKLEKERDTRRRVVQHWRLRWDEERAEAATLRLRVKQLEAEGRVRERAA